MIPRLSENYRFQIILYLILRRQQSVKGKFWTVNGNDYDTPDGTNIRDYIHVVDLAKAHLAA